MRSLRAPLPLFVCAFGAAACAPEGGEFSSHRGEVRNGDPDREHRAVGALGDRAEQDGPYDYWCTATLIDRRHVVTAGHCPTIPAYQPRFVIGYDPNAADAVSIPIEGFLPHPDYDFGAGDASLYSDIAVLRLAREVTEVDPIPLATEVPARGSGLAVGYGFRDDGGDDERYAAPFDYEAVAEGSWRNLLLAPNGDYGLCANDSGGPLLDESGGATRLVGVYKGTNGIGDPCSLDGDSIFQRADRAAAFAAEARPILEELGGGAIDFYGSERFESAGYADFTVPESATGVELVAFLDGDVDLAFGTETESAACDKIGERVECSLDAEPGETVYLDYVARGTAGGITYWGRAPGADGGRGDDESKQDGLSAGASGPITGGCAASGGAASSAATSATALALCLLAGRRRRRRRAQAPGPGV